MKRTGGRPLQINILSKYIGAEKWRREWLLMKWVEDSEPRGAGSERERRLHITPAEPQWGSGLRDAMRVDGVEEAGDIATAEVRRTGQRCVEQSIPKPHTGIHSQGSIPSRRVQFNGPKAGASTSNTGVLV